MHIVEPRRFLEMGLDEIRNALESNTRHVEGALPCDGIEIRFTFELGIIERCKLIESRKAKISISLSEPSVFEEGAFRKGLPLKLCVPDKGGAVKKDVAGKCSAAERGVAENGGTTEKRLAVKGCITEVGVANESGTVKPGVPTEGGPGEGGSGGENATKPSIARKYEALELAC